MTVLDELEALVAEGYAVFPCSQKRPLTPHGFKSASVDMDVIRRWIWTYPGCRWAVDIPEGQMVFDVDPRNGGLESLERLVAEHGPIPADRCSRTRGGGFHFWLETDELVRQTTGLLAPGIDTKVGGKGYALEWPTPGYEWVWRSRAPRAPGWLEKQLRVPEPVQHRDVRIAGRAALSRYAAAALDDECRRVASTPIGAGLRNNALFLAAARLGELVGAGVLEDWRAAQALLAATTLPESEARSTIISGLNRGVRNPRQVSA